MSEVSILLVGNTSRREFREASRSLESLGRVVRAADVSTSKKALSDGEFSPDLVVVAQAFPSQFSPEEIGRLRRLAPLARMLALLGSWCEGETRTGKPWPGAIRVYWHQWPPRAAQELKLLAEGVSATWALPVTAGEEERAITLADRPDSLRSGRIAVCSRQWDMQDWLLKACRRHGYTTLRVVPGRAEDAGQVSAGIYDAMECSGDELELLDDFATRIGGAPVVVLLDFPRVEDRDRALSAGASAVLSKPLVLEDLYWQLDRLLGSREEDS